jgi:hypothetical protein
MNSNTITLAPIKMGSLSTAAQPAAATGTPPTAKRAYVPPSKRAEKKAELPTTLDFGDAQFPGMSSKILAKPVAEKPKVDFKKTVNDCIEREKLDEIERSKQQETDPWKMSIEEREAAGWVTLPMPRERLRELFADFKASQAAWDLREEQQW